jgi:hypothetical protein
MARPKQSSTDNRTERLTVRLRVDERVALDDRARRVGLSASEFTRAAALGAEIGAMQSPSLVDPELIRAINRIGVNLNQIARSLNSGIGMVPAALADTLAQVNAYLDRVQP